MARFVLDGDLEEILARYLHHLCRRGLSPRTLTSYGHQIRAYLRDVDYRTSTTEDIERWLDGLRLKKPRSRCCYVASIGGFHKWLTENELRADDPTGRLVRPKVPKMLPRPITTADLALVLEGASPMMRAWLCLAAHQGLRCCEIAGLTVEDVDHAAVQPVLRLRETKGSKPRVLPLSTTTLAALRAYGLPEVGPVFRDGRGQPFTAYEVSRQGAAHLRASGVDATMHRLRHLFGTSLYRETRDLLLVGTLLGHARADTTAGYAEVTLDDRAFEAVEALSAVTPAPAPPAGSRTTLPEALRAVRAVADSLGVIIVEMYLDDGIDHGHGCECCLDFDDPTYPALSALLRGELPWTYEAATTAGFTREDLRAAGIRLAS